MAWDSDKTIGGATVSGSEWNTMVGVIKTPLITAGVTADSTELNYVDGVTSNLQSQLDYKFNKQLIIPTIHNAYIGLFSPLLTSVALNPFNVCMLSNSSGLILANATVASTANSMLVMATTIASSNTSASVLTTGFIANSSWNFIQGNPIYLDVTAGAIASSQPTGTGKIVRIVGYALSSSVLNFNPDNTYVELT